MLSPIALWVVGIASVITVSAAILLGFRRRIGDGLRFSAGLGTMASGLMVGLLAGQEALLRYAIMGRWPRSGAEWTAAVIVLLATATPIAIGLMLLRAAPPSRV